MIIWNKSQLKFFSLFIFPLIFISIIPKIYSQIKIPITKDMNSYYIKAFFDKDKKRSEFIKINMALDFTFIPLSQNYSKNEDSNGKTYSEDEIVEIDNKEFNTKLISTNYFIFEEQNNMNLNNLRFYYIHKKDLDKYDINKGYNVYNNLYYGQLGLGPLYDDDNLNILYALKQQNLINYMSFGIYFGENKNNNYLYLGNIDENKKDVLGEKEASFVVDLDKKLLKKYNKWGTRIEGIVVDKTNKLIKHSRHKYFAYFNLIEDRIFVPDKIMEYLISRVFSIYIDLNICFVTEYSDKKFINCKKNKIEKEKDNFPSIVFVIKKYGFKLTYEDLFIDSIKEDEVIFIIQKNYYDIDTSIILFGSRFFKKYLIQFDMEKRQIIFNSKNILTTINLDEIEDDFWKDLVRDYNKETIHYDSNYQNDGTKKKKKEKKNEKNNKMNITNKNEINEKDNNEDNQNEEKKLKIEFSYNALEKIIWGVFIFIIILVGIFVFFHIRKKIRIDKQKSYFNEPLNK